MAAEGLVSCQCLSPPMRQLRTSGPLSRSRAREPQRRHASVGYHLPFQVAVPSTQEPRSCDSDRVAVANEHDVLRPCRRVDQFPGQEPADTAVDVRGALAPAPPDVTHVGTGWGRLGGQGASQPTLQAPEGLLAQRLVMVDRQPETGADDRRGHGRPNQVAAPEDRRAVEAAAEGGRGCGGLASAQVREGRMVGLTL